MNTSSRPTADPDAPSWSYQTTRFGLEDLAALLFWTSAVIVYFWDVVTLNEALFYFDVTEINYPYRHYLAEQLRTGQFSRWMPGLYCGFPLFSESQAGYLHPLKYLFYPWLPTWQALNLDTVASVWLAGLGTFGWLRRHVGSLGALTGAILFGFGGFTWAHIVHTSMTNALASVPFALWALEASWARGRLRPLAVGGFAVACQVFSGHLQDTLLTCLVLGIYGTFKLITERTWAARRFVVLSTGLLVLLAGTLSAVQWVPSLELLERSPRAEGLTYDELTYGSWHPELLPTAVLREAYGTRAKDTDWMDGYYPYHEMNTYLGLVGLTLALVGASAVRDRWAAGWIVLAVVAGLFMLGRYTWLFDQMNHVPIIGSSRIPVRYHLWLTIAVAALAALGVDRLARVDCGRVRLRIPLLFACVLLGLALSIALAIYQPAMADTSTWNTPYHRDRFTWLSDELLVGGIRTVVILAGGWLAAARAGSASTPRTRHAWACLLPLIVTVDLLGAHWRDVPSIDPNYWIVPPDSVLAIQSDIEQRVDIGDVKDSEGFDLIPYRIFGVPRYSAGEPGYASESKDFFVVRDPLGWSLPPVWGLNSSSGITPMFPERMKLYTDATHGTASAFQIEGVTHLLSGYEPKDGAVFGIGSVAGASTIYRNPKAMPRFRLLDGPIYAEDARSAQSAVVALGASIRDRLVVEDPNRPIAESVGGPVEGQIMVLEDQPERLDIQVEVDRPAYLTIADAYDPGWSAWLDGEPIPIRPAWIAFRAILIPEGSHRLELTYEPAGFRLGLVISGFGALGTLLVVAWPVRIVDLRPTHDRLGWPRLWPGIPIVLAALVILTSLVSYDPETGTQLQARWRSSWHPFTWGAGIDAMRQQNEGEVPRV